MWDDGWWPHLQKVDLMRKVKKLCTSQKSHLLFFEVLRPNDQGHADRHMGELDKQPSLFIGYVQQRAGHLMLKPRGGFSQRNRHIGQQVRRSPPRPGSHPCHHRPPPSRLQQHSAHPRPCPHTPHESTRVGAQDQERIPSPSVLK